MPGIIEAIKKSDIDLLKKCLEECNRMGENPHIPDSEGRTPLIWAAVLGHTDIFELLQAQGAATTHLGTWRDNAGNNVLHYAACCDLALVRCLLKIAECRALINEENSYGWTAIMHSAMGGLGDIVKLLKDEGDKTNLIDWRDLAGSTLLHVAVRSGSLAGVRYLLSIREFEKFINVCGQIAPPLGMAAKMANLEMVQCLLGAGASPIHLYNSSEIKISQDMLPEGRMVFLDGNGLTLSFSRPVLFTPTPEQEKILFLLKAAEELLDLANGKQTERSLEDLLALGISVNLRNAEGKTLLHLAAGRGDEALVAKILKNGGNLYSKDDAGLTVSETMLQLAEQKKQYHILANRSLDEAQKAYENKQEKEAKECVDRAMKYVEETEKTADAFCAQGLYMLGMRLKNYFHCYDGALRAFRRVHEETPVYPEAQWELANMYLVELGVPEKDRVETAYLHIHEAGEDAATVRTRIMGMLLGKGFEENDIDPKTGRGALALMKQLAESNELNRNRNFVQPVTAATNSATLNDVCEDAVMSVVPSASVAPVTPSYTAAIKPRENLQKRKSLPRAAKERASKKFKK